MDYNVSCFEDTFEDVEVDAAHCHSRLVGLAGQLKLHLMLNFGKEDGVEVLLQARKENEPSNEKYEEEGEEGGVEDGDGGEGGEDSGEDWMHHSWS